MKIRVLFFAVLKEKMKKGEAAYEASCGETVAEVGRRILGPVLGEISFGGFLRFAVNGEYVLEDRIVQDGDEIAFIPPVAGG